MSSPERYTVCLSRQAERDVESILQYTYETYGERQQQIYAAALHEAFETITDNPGLGHTGEPGGPAPSPPPSLLPPPAPLASALPPVASPVPFPPLVSSPPPPAPVFASTLPPPPPLPPVPAIPPVPPPDPCPFAAT